MVETAPIVCGNSFKCAWKELDPLSYLESLIGLFGSSIAIDLVII